MLDGRSRDGSNKRSNELVPMATPITAPITTPMATPVATWTTGALAFLKRIFLVVCLFLCLSAPAFAATAPSKVNPELIARNDITNGKAFPIQSIGELERLLSSSLGIKLEGQTYSLQIKFRPCPVPPTAPCFFPCACPPVR
jgi:hypothetical protein